jgi:Tfp pilus assembly protein FimT
MAIACLIVGMAIPLFSSTLAKARADSAVEEVAMTLRLANQKSVFQQTKHDLVIDFRKQTYWLEFMQPGKHSKKLKMRPDQTRTLTGGFQFLLVYYPNLDDSENRHKAHVSFFPDGTATDSVVFIGRVSPQDSSTYDSLFGIEIRSGDGRVRVLSTEEREAYDYLL